MFLRNKEEVRKVRGGARRASGARVRTLAVICKVKGSCWQL